MTLAVPQGAAQRGGRIATTATALTAFPLFFHGKQVVVRASTTTSTGELTQLADAPKPVFVLWRERSSRNNGEIRGDFWDIGRLQEGDTRLTGIDLQPILDAANQGRWPSRDQLFAITGATFSESELPTAPGIRAIALAPEKYENRKVTLAGRFRGANLYGDVPQGLGKGKWDFVLHSADAAVWVTGIRPRGKDFDLSPTARVDTSRWLEVTGVVHREGPQAWIVAETVKLATVPDDEPVAVAVPLPKEPPPRVIFTAPVADDTDVERAAPIRIQFSRDMAGKSFTDRVRVTYVTTPAGSAPLPPYTATYLDGNRAVEIRFNQPLERFMTVKVELLEGITATDGQPLAPWTLTFSTGATSL